MGALGATIEGLFRSPIALKNLLDDLPFGVALLDSDRRILLLNRVLESITGFSTDAVLGVPCRHVLRNRMCIQGCPALKLPGKSGPAVMESDLINRDRQLVSLRVTIAALKDLKGGLAGFIESVEDTRALKQLHPESGQPYGFGRMIGRSPRMEKVFQILPSIAQSDSSVLITGETGTGKDLVAEAIHHASARARGPFVKVNCGALPETLLESELFGHRKGAFTGAVESKPGRFRLAHNGTLYLTEIGDLPLSLQVKLLTFLDDRIIFPLGSTRGFEADVRVIAATHRDLDKMARDGLFREDLLFRLNVVRLHLPPLRDRQEDIGLLLDHFLRSLSQQMKRETARFSKRALRTLMNYAYPGNVRELRNIVEYAINVCHGNEILPEHLPDYLASAEKMRRSSAEEEVGTSFAQVERIPLTQEIRAEDDWVPESWAKAEKRMILDALIKTGGRRARAAALLGWGRSTLWRKMKEHGIAK